MFDSLFYCLKILAMFWLDLVILLYWLFPNMIYWEGLSTDDKDILEYALDVKKQTQVYISYILTFQLFKAQMMSIDWTNNIHKLIEKITDYDEKKENKFKV